MAISTIGASALGNDVLQLGKNLLINGALTVAQRGSVNAGAGAGGSAYTQCDRWYYHERGGTEGAAVTLTQDTDVPSGQGFSYSLKCDVTTAEAAVAAGEMQGLQTRIEAQNLQHLIYGNANAKTVVLSFWFKSPKSGTHCVGLYQPDGTRSYIREFTVASADTWEQHDVTFLGDTSGTINNDAGEGLRLTFALTGGSTYQAAADAWAAGEDYATSNQQNLLDSTANNVYITGVQLEVGSVATDFAHQSYAEDLAACQRYYEQHDFDGASQQNISLAKVQTASSTTTGFKYLTQKRAAPTITFSAASTFLLEYNGTTTSGLASIYADHITDQQCRVVPSVSSGLTVDEVAMWCRDATDTAFMKISAEL